MGQPETTEISCADILRRASHHPGDPLYDDVVALVVALRAARNDRDEAQADLATNAALLARQTDLARQAEVERDYAHEAVARIDAERDRLLGTLRKGLDWIALVRECRDVEGVPGWRLQELHDILALPGLPLPGRPLPTGGQDAALPPA